MVCLCCLNVACCSSSYACVRVCYMWLCVQCDVLCAAVWFVCVVCVWLWMGLFSACACVLRGVFCGVVCLLCLRACVQQRVFLCL